MTYPAVDIVALAELAADIITQVGLFAGTTMTRRVTVVNHATGTYTEMPQVGEIRAVQAKLDEVRPDLQAAWASAAAVLYVPAFGLTFPPALDCRVLWHGRDLAVSGIDAVDAAGTVIGYYLALGANTTGGNDTGA